MTPDGLPSESFESIVPLLIEQLPQSVASIDARTLLTQCAGSLPLIIKGGFEYRLDGVSDQVDFHQLWQREAFPQLRSFLAQQKSPLFEHPIWQRIAGLLTQCDPSATDSLYEQISALLLEFDGVMGDAALLPSIFVAFDRQRPAENFATAQQSLRILCDSPPSPPLAFQRCFELQSAYWISHLGIMLARPNAPFRLNLQPQRWDALTPTLRELGWRGDFNTLSRLLDWLPQHVDRYTIALDVDSTIHPHIGLELFLSPEATTAEAARSFVTALIDRGLARVDKSDGLLCGTKWITPFNTKSEWPDALILQALRDPKQRLSAIIMKRSHVKLTIYPDGKIASKGYLAFGEQWLDDDMNKEHTLHKEQASMAHESS